MVRLQVNIISASTLKNTDGGFIPGDVSDPFCVCEVVGQPENRVETHVINNDLHPKWNYQAVLEYDGVSDLRFSVWDKDYIRKQLLGEHVMPAAVVKQGFSGTVSLTPGRPRILTHDPRLTVKVVMPQETTCGSCSIL
mmetsp:Transcript_33037/g.71907  ORF Transcript_33037/g.71907 Transcript_33037/m.71907 type:complete len:138 (+) Transcript_33037:47-460(+)